MNISNALEKEGKLPEGRHELVVSTPPLSSMVGAALLESSAAVFVASSSRSADEKMDVREGCV